MTSIEIDELIFEFTNSNITQNNQIFDFEKQLHTLNSEMNAIQNQDIEDQKFDLLYSDYQEKIQKIVRNVSCIQKQDFQPFSGRNNLQFLGNAYNEFIDNLHQIETQINSQLKQINQMQQNFNIVEDQQANNHYLLNSKSSSSSLSNIIQNSLNQSNPKGTLESYKDHTFNKSQSNNQFENYFQTKPVYPISQQIMNKLSQDLSNKQVQVQEKAEKQQKKKDKMRSEFNIKEDGRPNQQRNSQDTKQSRSYRDVKVDHIRYFNNPSKNIKNLYQQKQHKQKQKQIFSQQLISSKNSCGNSQSLSNLMQNNSIQNTLQNNLVNQQNNVQNNLNLLSHKSQSNLQNQKNSQNFQNLQQPVGKNQKIQSVQNPQNIQNHHPTQSDKLYQLLTQMSPKQEQKKPTETKGRQSTTKLSNYIGMLSQPQMSKQLDRIMLQKLFNQKNK